MTTTRDKVITLRIWRPDATLAAIGAEVGVGRERVHQILAEAGLPTRGEQPPLHTCACGARIAKQAKRCMACIRKMRWVTLTCSVCTRPFPRLTSQYRGRAVDPRYTTGRVYCSSYCFGKEAGPKHGFAVNGASKAHSAASPYAIGKTVLFKSRAHPMHTGVVKARPRRAWLTVLCLDCLVDYTGSFTGNPKRLDRNIWPSRPLTSAA